MADECHYTIKVWSENREAIDRFISIMRGEDKEYFLYRVFSSDSLHSAKEEGLFSEYVFGEVAWSTSCWILTDENFSQMNKNGAHYANLQVICKNLNIAVEIWSSECGGGFQCHHIITNNGDLIENKTLDWTYNFDIETGIEEESGGFGDGFEIWGEPEFFVRK